MTAAPVADDRRRAGVRSAAQAGRTGSDSTDGSGCSSRGPPRRRARVLALRFLTDRPGAGAVACSAGARSGWPGRWRRSGGRARRDRARATSGASQAAASGCSRVIYFLTPWSPTACSCGCRGSCARPPGSRGFKLSAITAIPFVVALAAMVLIGRHSDRTGERKWHVAACALTAAIGLVLAARSRKRRPDRPELHAVADRPARRDGRVLGAFRPSSSAATAAAAGIALINAVGQPRRVRRSHDDGLRCATAPAAIPAGCWCSRARSSSRPFSSRRCDFPRPMRQRFPREPPAELNGAVPPNL